MSTTRQTISLSLGNIIGIWTAFVSPAIGLLITVIIFGTKMVGKVENLTTKVEAISVRQESTDEKINAIHSRVDTIERRQAIYQATHR